MRPCRAQLGPSSSPAQTQLSSRSAGAQVALMPSPARTQVAPSLSLLASSLGQAKLVLTSVGLSLSSSSRRACAQVRLTHLSGASEELRPLKMRRFALRSNINKEPLASQTHSHVYVSYEPIKKKNVLLAPRFDLYGIAVFLGVARNFAYISRAYKTRGQITLRTLNKRTRPGELIWTLDFEKT